MSLGGGTPSPERRADPAALVIAVLLIAAGAVVAWDIAHMRAGVAAYSRIGPKAFPFAIAAGLIGLGVLTAIQALRERASPVEHDEVEHDEWRPIAWIVGGLIAQILLLPYAGFAVSTGAVFAATARAFGRGPLWFTYPVGVVMSLAIWLFFSKGLQLVLPAGPLERLF
jgi:putative tricarboxylic transport membrane protein